MSGRKAGRGPAPRPAFRSRQFDYRYPNRYRHNVSILQRRKPFYAWYGLLPSCRRQDDSQLAPYRSAVRRGRRNLPPSSSTRSFIAVKPHAATGSTISRSPRSLPDKPTKVKCLWLDCPGLFDTDRIGSSVSRVTNMTISGAPSGLFALSSVQHHLAEYFGLRDAFRPFAPFKPIFSACVRTNSAIHRSGSPPSRDRPLSGQKKRV